VQKTRYGRATLDRTDLARVAHTSILKDMTQSKFSHNVLLCLKLTTVHHGRYALHVVWLKTERGFVDSSWNKALVLAVDLCCPHAGANAHICVLPVRSSKVATGLLHPALKTL
jgi:hypothetical protein